MHKTIEYAKKAQLDKQGDYFWSLVMQAGWDRIRVAALLGHHYQKTHWNLLDKNEKRGVIAILKNYVAKEIKIKEKKLRQKIYAKWLKNGFKKEELQDLMVQWGFGNSVGKCEYKTLLIINENINKIVGAYGIRP